MRAGQDGEEVRDGMSVEGNVDWMYVWLAVSTEIVTRWFVFGPRGDVRILDEKSGSYLHNLYTRTCMHNMYIPDQDA